MPIKIERLEEMTRILGGTELDLKARLKSLILNSTFFQVSNSFREFSRFEMDQMIAALRSTLCSYEVPMVNFEGNRPIFGTGTNAEEFMTILGDEFVSECRARVVVGKRTDNDELVQWLIALLLATAHASCLCNYMSVADWVEFLSVIEVQLLPELLQAMTQSLSQI